MLTIKVMIGKNESDEEKRERKRKRDDLVDSTWHSSRSTPGSEGPKAVAL